MICSNNVFRYSARVALLRKLKLKVKLIWWEMRALAESCWTTRGKRSPDDTYSYRSQDWQILEDTNILTALDKDPEKVLQYTSRR